MVIIRPAESGDAAECLEIYRPYVTDNAVSFEIDPPSISDMAKRINTYQQSHAWFVAEEDGHILGYSYGSPHRSRAAYASSAEVAIYIRQERRRLGFASKLYETLFSALKAKQIHAVFAGITLPNDASIGFHKAMGFARVGIYREVGRKFGALHDVGWWQRIL